MVTRDSPIYRDLVSVDAPAWARRWSRAWTAGSGASTLRLLQHDALTLTAALGRPFVSFDVLLICLDDLGRTSVDKASEVPIHRSLHASYRRS